ncbi:MAG: glycerate kinase [Dehalococcoidia bacterium]|nr:glycerate kinase [Dehalococcoidia bacterium]
MKIRDDALKIIDEAIAAVLPERKVKEALEDFESRGTIKVIAIGKAAWRMAQAARESLQDKISEGIVITKYRHSMGNIAGFEILEAGHPIPDRNTILATRRALEMVKDIKRGDLLLFLVSGGGSSLFELPADNVTLEDLINITDRLVKSGASISEINTVRKHLSLVKGGHLAEIVKPAGVFTLALSDVMGDRPDTIASGPACPDSTTCEEALATIKEYHIDVSPAALVALRQETPKSLDNVTTKIIGNISIACEAAGKTAEKLGYHTAIATTTLDCEAREAGAFLSAVAREVISEDRPVKKPCAIISGGETIVHVKGKGLGGRNQELALSAARGIEGLDNVVIASAATDGTDGPTNAAGGIVDGKTAKRVKEQGFDIEEILNDNDAYHALKASGDLLETGPTGTNVNDLMILLCR